MVYLFLQNAKKADCRAEEAAFPGMEWMRSLKVAVIGSRELTSIDLGRFLPPDTEEIISGGAKGIDTVAKEYATAHHIKLTEYLPDYARYGRSAPLRRNITIIEHADIVLAFWNGKSRGTAFVIRKCREMGKSVSVFLPVL